MWQCGQVVVVQRAAVGREREKGERGGRMVKCLHYHSECILGLGITNYEKDTERSYFMMIYSQYFQLQQSLEGVLVHTGDLVIIQL